MSTKTILGTLSEWDQSKTKKYQSISLSKHANQKLAPELQCSKVYYCTQYNKKREEMDALAKIYFIGPNSPVKSHQIWPYGLNKLKYSGKTSRRLKYFNTHCSTSYHQSPSILTKKMPRKVHTP